MIVFKDGRYFAAMWFVTGKSADWLAVVYRDGGDEHWIIEYRFRYFANGATPGADDKKHWFKVRSKDGDTEEQVAAAVDSILEALTAEGFVHPDAPPCRVEIRSDNEERCAEILLKQPFARIEMTGPGGSA